MDLALRLLHEAKVITIPGSGFGPTGEGHIRISFGAVEDELNEAFDRIEAWAERSLLVSTRLISTLGIEVCHFERSREIYACRDLQDLALLSR